MAQVIQNVSDVASWWQASALRPSVSNAVRA